MCLLHSVLNLNLTQTMTLKLVISYVHQCLPEQQSVLSAVSLVSGSRLQVGDAFKLEMWP